MKYIFASDIHGSAHYCRKLLDKVDEIGADRLVLLGDILYHGPRNNLPGIYEPKDVAQMLNEYNKIISCVRGNCDAEVDQMLLNFPALAEYAVIELEGQRIYITHGHWFNIDNPLPLKEGDILMYGHTHIPLDETRDGIRYLNPGSVSIPKGGSNHSCLLYEDGEFRHISLE